MDTSRNQNGTASAWARERRPHPPLDFPQGKVGGFRLEAWYRGRQKSFFAACRIEAYSAAHSVLCGCLFSTFISFGLLVALLRYNRCLRQLECW